MYLFHAVSVGTCECFYHSGWPCWWQPTCDDIIYL